MRLREDRDGDLWFTSQDVQNIPIEVVPRRSEDDWVAVHTQAARVPYQFETRPAIRFILVQSPARSELIILCHHNNSPTPP